jgi:hypothetical protein
MIRDLKKLGLALAAIAALGAMAAPAARAVPEFTAFNPSTLEHPAEASLHGTLMESLEGSSNHEFSTSGGTVKCTTATFTGTLTAPASTTQTVVPTYSGCKGPFGETAHVAMNSCEYLFHLQTEASEGKYTGTFDLLCPTSEGPTVTTTTTGGVAKCVVDLEPDQEGLSTANFRGAKGAMEFEPGVASLAYTATGGFFNCGVGPTTQTNGGYKGNATVTAKAGETELAFQAAPSTLVSTPGTLKIEIGKENKGEIKLSTTGKNKMQIESKPSSPAYKVKTENCFQKEVPCSIEIECILKNIIAPLTSTGFDLKTEEYHAAVSKVECLP